MAVVGATCAGSGLSARHPHCSKVATTMMPISRMNSFTERLQCSGLCAEHQYHHSKQGIHDARLQSAPRLCSPSHTLFRKACVPNTPALKGTNQSQSTHGKCTTFQTSSMRSFGCQRNIRPADGPQPESPPIPSVAVVHIQLKRKGQTCWSPPVDDPLGQGTVKDPRPGLP